MLLLILVAAAVLFGGVYRWAALVLSAGVGGLLFWTRPAIAPAGAMRVLDLSLLAVLAGIALQLVPLPAAIVSFLSPARIAYLRASSLQSDVPSFVPLTLDRAATLHALIAAFCTAGAFWAARSVFARRGVRTVITGLAWAAVILVVAAFAQATTGTHLVYGFWQPIDEGARPLGPFINRNHFGTWSLLVFFLCLGCLQWRSRAAGPSRGWSWRARLAHALDGRSMILGLALLLLVLVMGFGASRSTMLALAGGAGYVAATAPRRHDMRRSVIRMAALALAALFVLAAYADVDRLLSRVGETRRLGLSQRVVIWRDTVRVIRDFPMAGIGAGAFSNAMRLYQTTDRTYYWNEAHNEYLQVAAEGGLLVTLPVCGALGALGALMGAAIRRRDDPVHWLRLGGSAGLLAVAIQAIWETGLSLPANGMLAAAAAALTIQGARSSPEHGSHLPPSHHDTAHPPHAASRY
ncbi:MAG: O-antigen ligase family protein [Burkholderiales bacterium]